MSSFTKRPRLWREIALVLLVKMLLLLIVLDMVTPSGTATDGIESHLLNLRPKAISVESAK